MKPVSKWLTGFFRFNEGSNMFDEREYLTTNELARAIGCNGDTIRSWIASGQLHAIDARRTDSQRPKWRISQASWEAFETQRAYFMAMQDLGIERCERAFVVAMQKCKWFPKPVELREFVKLPGEDPEYRAGQASQLALKHGITGRAAVDFQDPLINAVIRRLGGLDYFAQLGAVEAERYVRKRFIDEYLRLDGHGSVSAKLAAPLRCQVTIKNEPIRIEADYMVHQPRIASEPNENTGLIAELAERTSIDSASEVVRDADAN